MLEMHWIPDSNGRLTIVWKPAERREAAPAIAVVPLKEPAARDLVETGAALETQRAA